ncbi:MAG: valyl-tRNA synthetase [Sphingobacteriales bacterium]|jgi:valyl-tRNA synthetase
MALATKYNPLEVEDKWYKYWLDNKLFKSVPDEREAYSVVIPPPNVTGVLHMGHMLNNTLQDVLVRRARMLGKNACWVPGTDHASIATEAKVVAKLRAEGIKKGDLSREEFLSHAWDWKEKYGGIILEQLKKLGASCDWDRTKFTMDPKLSDAVQEVFIDLHKKGYIYRGLRMVNWDPVGLTAVSDEEVIHREIQSKLYHVKYAVVGSNETVTIATTRPETILGDTAVCVHPDDDRYKHLVGKKVIVPMVNREVPVIADEYVDIEFGTGCLKITPAHDENDYHIGAKHNLETIDILNPDGTMAEAAGFFIGEDRFIARKKIAKKLKALDLLIKEEEYTNKVGFSERTDAVIEPRLSKQWFVSMEKLAKPALDAVMNDDILLFPPKFKNTYRHWMENVKDWCISRQLWWGQRIPAFYYGDGDEDYVVTASADEALELAKAKTGNQNLTTADLKQDDDVMDTWFSSWLWPISVFDGFDPDSEDFKYYYPTNDLVTAPEILFFWVARMIIAGYEYKGEMPFKNVYLHGIVRDKQRRKMSKSLGNSPNPLDLIAEYGADGVRVGMLLCAPAGNDILYDDSLVEQGRNFSNKIWNAYRLIDGWEVDSSLEKDHSIAINWFENKFNEAMTKVEEQFSQFRISEALMTLYKLVWDDFCSWYLEMVKPPYLEKIDAKTYEATKSFFERLMLALHPIMPFITEELWQSLAPRKDGESISVLDYPKPATFNEAELAEMDILLEVVSQVRNIRNNRGMSPKVQIPLKIKTTNQALYKKGEELVVKMANLESLEFTDEKVSGAITFIIKNDECFAELEETINVEEELAKLSDELKRMQGFLFGVSKKLSNEKFVSFAPDAVVAMGKKKQADAVAKIKALEENIAELKG